MKKRLIEACHYYETIGMTSVSLLGKEIVDTIKKLSDMTMILIDDIHTYQEAPENEKTCEITGIIPEFDFLVHESKMYRYALTALDTLKGLSYKKRAKSSDGTQYFCSGFAVTNRNGIPACILLTLGLCFYKKELGFSDCINVLPIHYEELQNNLQRLIKKVWQIFG